MTTQRPLVVKNGQTEQLQPGDTIPGSVIDSYAANNVIYTLRRCIQRASVSNPRTSGLASGANAPTVTSDGATDTTAAYYAFGTLTSNGTAPSNNDTVTIGGKVYTFQTVLTNVDGHVLIGASAAAALANLMNAINLGAGSGTTYAAATTLNTSVSATNPTTLTLLAIAKITGNGAGGTTGASTTTTKIAATLTWSGATLAINKTTYTFPNSGTFTYPTVFRYSGGQPFATAGGSVFRAGFVSNNSATLTNSGTNVSNGDTVTIGGGVYTFQTVLTNVAGNVNIGASNTASMTNLFNAINATGGGVPGTDYAAACVPNPYVTATNPTGTTVTVTASFVGGQVTTAKSAATLTWNHTVTQSNVSAQLSDGSISNWARVEFMTDSLAPSIGVTTTTAAYRFIVDGQYVSLTGTTTATTTGTSVNYLTLAFAARATRKIIVELQAGCAFFSVKVGPTEKVWQTDGNDIITGTSIGDSYDFGSDAAVLGDGVTPQLSDWLGIRDMRSSGSGGTGWATAGAPTTAYTFGQRIANGDVSFPVTFGAAAAAATTITATVPAGISMIPSGLYVTNLGNPAYVGSTTLASGATAVTVSALANAITAGEVAYTFGSRAPSVVFVRASYNDRNGTPATITANCLAGLQSIRAMYPQALIIALGAGVGSTGPSAGIIAAERAVAAAVTQFADTYTGFVPFVTGANGSLITGTGNVGAPTGTGNADIYINADGVHPVDPAGLQYHGRVLAQGVMSLLSTWAP